MIDVIIPAFNASGTIRRAILSALEARDVSVLVIDDGSTDETAAIATAAGASVWRQENAGAARARVNGLSRTTSPFVIFLDADDELIAAGIERSVAILESDPRLAAVAGRLIGRAGRKSQLLPNSATDLSPAGLLRLGRGPWPPAAAVIRRSALTETMSLPMRALEPRYAEDYEMFLRLALVGRMSTHEEPSAAYTMYGGKSMTGSIASLRAKEEIRDYYATELGISISRMSERDIRAASLSRSLRRAAAHRDVPGLAINGAGLLMHPAFLLRKLQTRIRKP